MKKIIPVVIIAFLVFPFIIASKTNAAVGVTGHKIIIDAGHGGDDPGTTQCEGLYESDANLMIAELLKEKLEASGAIVYMTREDDSTLSNEDRYTFANGTDGEVLVSIHLNGSTDHTVNGTKGLYAKISKDKAFTTVLHNQLVEDKIADDMGIANFMSGVILKFVRPATIQESVYLSNTVECTALKDPSGDRADQIAQSLYNGLDKWFSQSVTPIIPGKRNK